MSAPSPASVVGAAAYPGYGIRWRPTGQRTLLVHGVTGLFVYDMPAHFAAQPLSTMYDSAFASGLVHGDHALK